MNETERERIMGLVAEGVLRPSEAAQLLAALADEAPKTPTAPVEEVKLKPKQEPMEVQMQRPDGSKHTVEVPPHLLPALVKIATVAIKEEARTAGREAWAGLKIMVRNKSNEVRTTVTTRVRGTKKEPVPGPSAAKLKEAEARARILQMVQNGRLTATDAGRLIQELDALKVYETAHTPTSPSSIPNRGR